MDEKTAELRDIFVEVADAETVTERQEEGRGSLATDDAVDDRLAEVVAEMRDALGFSTSLSDDELVTVVRRFYAGDSDDAIAQALDEDAPAKGGAAAEDGSPVEDGSPAEDGSPVEVVWRARLDLHLLRESDLDAPFDLDALREALDEDAAVEEIADRLDASLSAVRRYSRVLETRAEIRRVNDVYRGEFENVLSDRDITERLTSGVRDDGLEEATEGQEIDLPL